MAKRREALQRTMTTEAGVLRTAASIDAAERSLAEVAPGLGGAADVREVLELRNLHDVAAGLLAAARVREETRGATPASTTHRSTIASAPAWSSGDAR